jgi:hypothetical protein
MAPAAVGELLEEMLRAIYRGCEPTEARRLAFHLVGTAWHTERPGTSQPMHEMEELLSHIGAISEHDGKPSVSDAKTWLRTYGPRGSALASRVGRKSKTRNGMAHPDVTLMVEIDQLVGPKLQEVQTLHDTIQSKDPWAGSKFPVTQSIWKPTSASVWSTFQRGAHHKLDEKKDNINDEKKDNINNDEKKDNINDDKNGSDDTSSAAEPSWPSCLCGVRMAWGLDPDVDPEGFLEAGDGARCDLPLCVDRAIRDGTSYLSCADEDCPISNAICLTCAAGHFGLAPPLLDALVIGAC